jgi:hypothetical protein
MTDFAPKLNTALVGFIDLLGFKNELSILKTESDFKELYSKIKRVHEEFKKTQDAENEQTHKMRQKTVLSLSDVVVIAVDFDSPSAKNQGILDVLAIELYYIGFAQALCVIKGIFLRGGFSIGQFFYQNDILISQAMVEAYETESKHAVYPVLTMSPKLIVDENESSQPDIVPIHEYEIFDKENKKYIKDIAWII